MKFIDLKDHPDWQYIQDHPYTRIKKTATISGYACVYDNACVAGYAQISGNAIIRGNTCIFGNSKVCGYTEVSGHARIRGNGEILQTEDYIVIKSPNVYQTYLTLHRDKEIGIRINCNFNFSGTLQEYIFEHIKRKNQYFHQGMIAKYHNILKDRMTPLEAESI